jgi:hypothetical protein
MYMLHAVLHTYCLCTDVSDTCFTLVYFALLDIHLLLDGACDLLLL